MPLALLADTECEELEQRSRSTSRAVPADQGAVRRARRVGARGTRRAWCVNISSDAAVNAYPGWGAYGASKAALRHMTAIWDEEAAAEGVRFLSFDPGDMDTPLHALAVPDADPATLKRPEDCRRRADRRDRAPRLPKRADRARRRLRMIAADRPAPRAAARLLVVDAERRAAPLPRRDSARCSSRATSSSRTTPRRCPRASPARIAATGAPIEVRLAGWIAPDDPTRFVAVVFGAGDYRTRTEDRPPPPASDAGRQPRARSADARSSSASSVIRASSRCASPGTS